MIPIKQTGTDEIIGYGTNAMNAFGIATALNYYFYKAGIKFEVTEENNTKK